MFINMSYKFQTSFVVILLSIFKGTLLGGGGEYLYIVIFWCTHSDISFTNVILLIFTGIFCIILCVTIVLVSRIKPASRPPALYQPNTNLQRLLDLAYNFSGKDIRCTDCSGFDQGDLHPVIPIPNVPMEVPGMLSPNPVLPTHRPETTLWPPSEPPMIPTDAGGGGDGGVGGGGDGGGGGTVVTILGPPGHQTPLTTTSYSGNSPTPPPKSKF